MGITRSEMRGNELDGLKELEKLIREGSGVLFANYYEISSGCLQRRVIRTGLS